METGNGLKEGRGRIVGQHPLETAKGQGGRLKELRGIRLLQAIGVLNKGKYTPSLSLAICKAGIAALGAEDGKRFPIRVSPLFSDLLPQIVSHARDIAHDLLGMRKGRAGNALENVPFTGLSGHTEGIIDVAATIAGSICDLSPKVISRKGLLQVQFCFV